MVLIHGLWMTPRSWEHWIEYCERRGHHAIAPAYPGLEVEVEALREDPSPIEAVTVPDTVAHLERVIRALDEPPILIGHSYGGALVQILLDRGLGLAGGADHIMPAAVNKANADRYAKSGSHTDYREFEARDHYTIGEPGWEQVADYALTWATEHGPLSRRRAAARRDN